jgi:hypothetical protein
MLNDISNLRVNELNLLVMWLFGQFKSTIANIKCTIY